MQVWETRRPDGRLAHWTLDRVVQVRVLAGVRHLTLTVPLSTMISSGNGQEGG